MPSSRPNTIPAIINVLRHLKPQSILDVGVGFGKWGHLFREYTDIVQAEHDPARYHRASWKVRIDGIEGYLSYITEMHRFVYNEIFVGDALEIVRTIGSYDLIFLGDIIEHFEKQRGLELLRTAVEKATKAVIVSTPKFETGQEDSCGNPLERHQSLWTSRDFRTFPGATVKTIDKDTLLAVITKEGVTLPDLRTPKRVDFARLQSVRDCIEKFVPPTEPLILVDEEQISHLFKDRALIPFLERDGQYFGPPVDDRSAISELKRLHSRGAKYIAFISTTFWWLAHYRQFAEHLRSNFQCLAENDLVIVFSLDQPGA